MTVDGNPGKGWALAGPSFSYAERGERRAKYINGMIVLQCNGRQSPRIDPA
jgi:hypothetical protein